MARRAKGKQMTLKDYVGMVGTQKIAQTVEVSRQAVESWVRLESAPRPVTAFKLIQMSAGLLSYESIYAGYVESQMAKGAA